MTASMTVADGRAAGQRILDLPAAERPTAASCANDMLALGFLQEMTRQGIDVPNTMAIIAPPPNCSSKKAETGPGHVHR